MRIEFKYRLDDWLEWKRANLSAVRLFLLETAEAAEIPLSILSSSSIVIFLIKYLNSSAPMMSGWVPGILLTSLAIAELYLSRVPDLRKKVLKKEWKKWRARLEYKLDITENGIVFNSIQCNRTTWNRYTRVFQTKRLLMLCDGDRPDVLVIPKRALGSKERLDEFLELAYRKTVLERCP